MRHTHVDLERARSYVEDGERRVIAQKRLLNKLLVHRSPTAEAYELLKQLQSALDDMRQRLKKIEADGMRNC